MLYCLTDNINSDFKLELQTVQRLCETIDTPRSLAVALMLQYQEWEEYMDLSIDPSAYEGVGNFADDYLVTEILRKSPNVPLGIDRSANALHTFLKSEEQCRATNLRIREEAPSWHFTLKKNIRKILGPLTVPALDYIESRFRFGPGASTGVRGSGSSLSDKFDEPIHLTVELIPYFRCILGETWWEHHRQSLHTIRRGNKFTTVPKTAKTDRGICIEPTLNMYVQLGIGAYLRRRLRRFGIDLNTQQRNRDLARKAYSCSLATIDLSAASDSLASNLILHYFPEPWMELLSLPRSEECELPDGSYHSLEKFSSMGNGYTFELETLVFYAVCMTFIPFDEMHDVSVYGDDIIIPQKYTREVIEALEFLGFSVNTSKSFLAGNFFESCGEDYFKGINVRPFYLRGSKKFIPYELQIANRLRAYARVRNVKMSCDSRFRDLWQYLADRIPRNWSRCRVPLPFGDTGLIVSLDEAGSLKAKRGFEGTVCRHMVFRPVYKRKRTLGVLLAALSRSRYPLDFETLVQQSSEGKRLMQILLTKGREPRRGYLRLPRPRMSIVYRWTNGLAWDSES